MKLLVPAYLFKNILIIAGNYLTLLYSFFHLPLKLFIDLFIKVRFKVIIVTIDYILLDGYLLQLQLLNKTDGKRSAEINDCCSSAVLCLQYELEVNLYSQPTTDKNAPHHTWYQQLKENWTFTSAMVKHCYIRIYPLHHNKTKYHYYDKTLNT